MQEMATNLITSLRSSSLKLAAAMRTISWLRRVAPELGSSGLPASGAGEGSLGSLFLVCRLANLESMLGALEPLRELADQETLRLAGLKGEGGGRSGSKWDGGQQTERYLKRYIEIFREQSFAIISMYRSIFPASVAVAVGNTEKDEEGDLQHLPTALATFPMKLVAMLETTLRTYLPNVRDKEQQGQFADAGAILRWQPGEAGRGFQLDARVLE